MRTPGGLIDIVDIATIEHCGFAALPPEHSIEDGPWVLRMAGGLAKRANSANPRAPGAPLDADRLHRIERFYRHTGLVPIAPIVRITPLASPEADALLAARGYRITDRSLVMTAQLAPSPPATPPHGITLRIDTTIPDAWHDTFALFDGLDAHGRTTRRAMLDALDRPHAAITLRDTDGATLGIGLAVADGAYVGLFDVRVASAARGRGLGRAVTDAMLGWARTRATVDTPVTAYLQVNIDNAPALSLYRSLGFADAYAYHYRVGPA
ncbi:GNAT family N-acetyltransferase [Ralstonia soli]|uniref:GNAT family N-acetyltransferase n=1 Tax=Ralstonia soli TaxID=2953896 RepID=A0ABT1AQD1_9RALS|nr:GNAT family N-acetyltransferase [Ralstonia soli]MCO5400660.1 GNAT family N-acetyltransferase [Ralstonia soli]